MVERREAETRRMHAEADYSRMWVALYEDIVRNGEISRAAGYPVLVNGRYIMAPSPIPRWDVPKLHHGAAPVPVRRRPREADLRRPALHGVVPLAFEDYPFGVESFDGKRCARCGSPRHLPRADCPTSRAARLRLLGHRLVRRAAAMRARTARGRASPHDALGTRSNGHATSAHATPSRDSIAAATGAARRGPDQAVRPRLRRLPRPDRPGPRDQHLPRSAARSSPAPTSRSTCAPGRTLGHRRRERQRQDHGPALPLRRPDADRRRRLPAQLRRRRAQHLRRSARQERRRLRNFQLGMVYQHPREGLNLRITAGGNVAERLLAAEWRRVGQIRDRAGTPARPHGGARRAGWTTSRPTSAAACSSASRSPRPSPTARRGPARRDDLRPRRLGPGRRARPGPGDPARRGHGAWSSSPTTSAWSACWASGRW